MKFLFCGSILLVCCFAAAALRGEDAAPAAPYVAAPLANDLSGLAGNDIAALYHLVKAAAVMDRLFFRQAWSGNPKALEALRAYAGRDKESLREFFAINFGPFDRLNANRCFFGTAVKPLGSAFYPDDMSKGEFENTVKAQPLRRESFESPYTMVVRTAAGLQTVPYSEYYRDLL